MKPTGVPAGTNRIGQKKVSPEDLFRMAGQRDFPQNVFCGHADRR